MSRTVVWWVNNGIITSGQGTDAITVKPISAGYVTIGVTKTENGVTTSGVFTSRATNTPVTITTDVTAAPAGEPNHSASMVNVPGAGYWWEISNGYITSGQGTHAVTFALGEADEAAGARVHIQCRTSISGSHDAVQSDAYVDILPYPHTYALTTNAVLAPGELEYRVLSMGRKWLVKAITTSAPARVRIYASASQRTNDLAREVGTAPTGDHGLLCEVITTTTKRRIDMHPWAIGNTPLGTAYVSVVNTGVTTSAITTTFAIQMEEA